MLYSLIVKVHVHVWSGIALTLFAISVPEQIHECS